MAAGLWAKTGPGNKCRHKRLAMIRADDEEKLDDEDPCADDDHDEGEKEEAA